MEWVWYKMRRFHSSRLNKKRNRSDIQHQPEKNKKFWYLLDGFLAPLQAPDNSVVAFIQFRDCKNRAAFATLSHAKNERSEWISV